MVQQLIHGRRGRGLVQPNGEETTGRASKTMIGGIKVKESCEILGAKGMEFPASAAIQEGAHTSSKNNADTR